MSIFNDKNVMLVGLKGKDGLSAYEVAVKNGFEGTEDEWLESLSPSNLQNGEGTGSLQQKGTTATYDNQATFGQYNDNKIDTLFEVGNGTSDTDRSNAFEVYKDGRAKLYGTAINANDVTTIKDVDTRITRKAVTKQTTSCPEGAAYMVNTKGENGAIWMTSTPSSGTVVRYASGGKLNSNNPTEALNVVNKQYLESQLVAATGKLYRHTITASVFEDMYNKVTWGSAIISFLSPQDTIYTLRELQHRLIGAFVRIEGQHNDDYLMCTFTGTVYEFRDDSDSDDAVSIMGTYYHSGVGFNQTIIFMRGLALTEGQYTIEQI